MFFFWQFYDWIFFVRFVRVFEVRPLGLIGGLLLFAILLDALATSLGAGKKSTNLRCRSSNGDKLSTIATKAQQWLSVAYVDALQLRRDNPSKVNFQHWSNRNFIQHIHLYFYISVLCCDMQFLWGDLLCRKYNGFFIVA